VADPAWAEKIDIAAEIDAARNAILAMSPEERASHLKRTAERIQERLRKIGTDPGHHTKFAHCSVVRARNRPISRVRRRLARVSRRSARDLQRCIGD